MSHFTSMKKQSISSFETLPNEILLHIFRYLASNDLIYCFINCNQRLQHLLLIQKFHFNLPTTDLKFWKEIHSTTGSQIQTLIINNDNLTVSLDFFPNVTSIIISSPYGLLDRQLRSILNHRCFPQLHTLKIKNVIRSKKSYNRNILDDEQILFTTIFNNNNSLQVFEYLPVFDESYYRQLDRLQSNTNIRSLTLNLTEFQDVFILIQNTPNLIYLNIQSEMPHQKFEQMQLTFINEIKLEEFYLKFKPRKTIGCPHFLTETDLDPLFRAIHFFSSSLITLSLDFTDTYLTKLGDSLANGIELEKQLLKSMTKLQNFYFYTKLYNCRDAQQILSTFQTFPWSIGVHQNTYLYSLPFTFPRLENFRDFQDVRWNREEELQHHPRLWSNVTSLELFSINRLDFRKLFLSIKLNMPKLSSITFHYNQGYHSLISCSEIERIDVQLDCVSTIGLREISIDYFQQILMYSFPNLQCLILYRTSLPRKENKITSFLGQNIQQIELDEISLQNRDISYLVNLKSFKLTCGLQYQPHIFSHILSKLLKLETLSICAVCYNGHIYFSLNDNFRNIMRELDEEKLRCEYEIKYSGDHMWFIRKYKTNMKSEDR